MGKGRTISVSEGDLHIGTALFLKLNVGALKLALEQHEADPDNELTIYFIAPFKQVEMVQQGARVVLKFKKDGEW